MGQLDALLGQAIERAWEPGAGPGDGRLVIDVDSFVGEVYGYPKQGAAFGYTQLLGFHPILATRADTREALHIRLRKGSANTQKGIERFCEELSPASSAPAPAARSAARRLGVLEHPGLRALRAGWQFSIGVRNSRRSKRPSRRSPRTGG